MVPQTERPRSATTGHQRSQLPTWAFQAENGPKEEPLNSRLAIPSLCSLHLFNNIGTGLHMQDYVVRYQRANDKSSLTTTIAHSESISKEYLHSFLMTHDFGTAHYLPLTMSRYYNGFFSPNLASELKFQKKPDYQDSTS